VLGLVFQVLGALIKIMSIDNGSKFIFVYIGVFVIIYETYHYLTRVIIFYNYL